jgi:hypothetical protein
MPLTYQSHGIEFDYPETWTLDESESHGEWPTVTVYSPDGAFWSVMVDSPAADPADMAVTVLRSLREEYAESDAEPAADMIAGQELRGYDVSFYYVDLISTAVIRAFRMPGLAAVILCQAEDREFREIEPVFQAMTTSLVQRLSKPSS